MSAVIKKILKSSADSYLSLVLLLTITNLILTLREDTTIKDKFTREFFYSLVWIIPILIVAVSIRVLFTHYINKKRRM